MTKTKAAIIATVVVGSAVGIGPAHAGGFLADTFIKPFSPHLAREADKVHAQLGNPLDHVANSAAGAAAEAIVPGSGIAVTGALEARRARH